MRISDWSSDVCSSDLNKLPVDNLAEFVDYAKKNSQEMSYSSSGMGNIQNISGELFSKLAGTHILHVPYKGSAQAVADVAGGQISATFASGAALLPFIQAGQVKAIGVSSTKPLSAFRSEARRGGKECGSTWRIWWST